MIASGIARSPDDQFLRAIACSGLKNAGRERTRGINPAGEHERFAEFSAGLVRLNHPIDPTSSSTVENILLLGITRGDGREHFIPSCFIDFFAPSCSRRKIDLE